MIPTRSKSKLASTLSWPIGAEAISRAMEGVPHAENFELSFYFNSSAASQQRLKKKDAYTIVTAEYRPAMKLNFIGSNAGIEQGWYDPKWKILVYPVLRELRHLAGNLLREKGLPSISEWLRLSKADGWEQREHRIYLIFDPLGESLLAKQEDGI